MIEVQAIGINVEKSNLGFYFLLYNFFSSFSLIFLLFFYEFFFLSRRNQFYERKLECLQPLKLLSSRVFNFFFFFFFFFFFALLHFSLSHTSLIKKKGLLWKK